MNAPAIPLPAVLAMAACNVAAFVLFGVDKRRARRLSTPKRTNAATLHAAMASTAGSGMAGAFIKSLFRRGAAPSTP